MLYSSTGEELYRGYVTEYDGNVRYKLMSKLTKTGAIFYVFYEQFKESIGFRRGDDEHERGDKNILHADIVYSLSTFQRRLRDLKKAYGISSWAMVILGK